MPSVKQKEIKKEKEKENDNSQKKSASSSSNFFKSPDHENLENVLNAAGQILSKLRAAQAELRK